MPMKSRRRRLREQASAQDLATPDINTTPLIDVMLVLLIMLIVTIPVRLDAVDMTTPPPHPAPPPRPPVVVELHIGPGEQVRWNRQPVPTQERLEQLLYEAAHSSPPVELHLRPSPRARYDAFARVLAAAQREGVTRMAIVEGPQGPQQP